MSRKGKGKSRQDGVAARVAASMPKRSVLTRRAWIGVAFGGHVPADLIRKLLADRPAFAGLSVPGVPNGAPGMEGATKDVYEVVAFARDGKTEVHAVRRCP